MSIKVVSDRCGAVDRCCFCWKPSSYWYLRRDVVVCPTCAKTHRVSEVPSKQVWCEETLRRYPHLLR